jgi:hypothetical protein
MPLRSASANFISGSSVPSMCTCNSHLGKPAMNSAIDVSTRHHSARAPGDGLAKRDAETDAD